jgi:hypothetical protein
MSISPAVRGDRSTDDWIALHKLLQSISCKAIEPPLLVQQRIALGNASGLIDAAVPVCYASPRRIKDLPA